MNFALWLKKTNANLKILKTENLKILKSEK